MAHNDHNHDPNSISHPAPVNLLVGVFIALVALTILTLFLASIWDEVMGDVRVFREEVRVTFLHELGHYLGLDEDEVEALGLG